MGLNFSFFGTPKKRVNYRPLYHDENEVLEERHAHLNDDRKGRENEEYYVHRRRTKGKFRRTTSANRGRRGKIDSAVIIGIVVLITILLLFFFAFYIAKSFGLYI